MFKKLIISLSLLTLSIGAFASDTPLVLMSTTLGDIEIELNNKKAPKTVANFLQYVKSDHYNGTIFHRVIKDFMIQGGGFNKDLQRGETKAAVQNEADNGLKNDLGTIAMARTNAPHSATDQFFINTNKKNNNFLNHTSKSSRGWGYAVFGKVTKGMDIVAKIEDVKTGARG
ncbi:Peptidyl-prolyl cis-trans isomerase PpiB, partial [hydrothermal vent metagenome]